MDQLSQEYDMRSETAVIIALARISGVSVEGIAECVKIESPRLLRLPCLENASATVSWVTPSVIWGV